MCFSFQRVSSLYCIMDCFYDRKNLLPRTIKTILRLKIASGGNMKIFLLFLLTVLLTAMALSTSIQNRQEREFAAKVGASIERTRTAVNEIEILIPPKHKLQIPVIIANGQEYRITPEGNLTNETGDVIMVWQP